jgi:MSHA biogenesis protein MshP
MSRPGSQRGFSLIAAIFLIVVLAALGMFASRIAMTQQQTVNFSFLEAQALAAANSGIEYGANRALKAGICANSTTLNLGGSFVVKVGCVGISHPALPAAKWSYALTSTATRGVYGKPDFVSRQVTRVVTTP